MNWGVVVCSLGRWIRLNGGIWLLQFVNKIVVYSIAILISLWCLVTVVFERKFYKNWMVGQEWNIQMINMKNISSYWWYVRVYDKDSFYLLWNMAPDEWPHIWYSWTRGSIAKWWQSQSTSIGWWQSWQTPWETWQKTRKRVAVP